MSAMDAAMTIRSARRAAALSLRELAARAGTSHATLAAYEAGRKVPTVETLDRVVRATGLRLRVDLVPSVDGIDPAARGRELIEALDLAAMFPASRAADQPMPRFGPR
jgi:transcriptional regulator with XRE-family HTH domain